MKTVKEWYQFSISPVLTKEWHFYIRNFSKDYFLIIFYALGGDYFLAFG